jgi:hypothetical protein
MVVPVGIAHAESLPGIFISWSGVWGFDLNQRIASFDM